MISFNIEKKTVILTVPFIFAFHIVIKLTEIQKNKFVLISRVDVPERNKEERVYSNRERIQSYFFPFSNIVSFTPSVTFSPYNNFIVTYEWFSNVVNNNEEYLKLYYFDEWCQANLIRISFFYFRNVPIGESITRCDLFLKN